MKDYYELLGVAKTATADQIKSAYRKLALQWHPDRNKTAEAGDKFKAINKAYEVLSDENKRKMYDQYGHDMYEKTGGKAGGQQGYGQSPYTSYTYSDFGEGSPFNFNGEGFSD